MKKILIGLFAFGSLSASAAEVTTMTNMTVKNLGENPSTYITFSSTDEQLMEKMNLDIKFRNDCVYKTQTPPSRNLRLECKSKFIQMHLKEGYNPVSENLLVKP